MPIEKINTLLAPLKRQIQTAAPIGAVLMYHRVTELESDPWSLSVSPQNFAAHLEVLQKHCWVMPLEDLNEAHQQKQLLDAAVAITFDDGYVDNLLNAKPLLEQAKLPATMFIASGCIGRSREFWWDELEKALLLPDQLPERLTLTAKGQTQTWELGNAAYYGSLERHCDRGIDPWKAVPTARLGFYFSVWKFLWLLPVAEQERLCDEVMAWAGVDPSVRESHRTITADELRLLDSGDYVTVGAHTVNHPHLPDHPMSVQQQEIEQGKQALEQYLGRSITTFSYPYGGFNKQTLQIIEQAGFSCACSTVQEMVWWRSDRFQLPRFEVKNWDGETFEKQLLAWLSRNSWLRKRPSQNRVQTAKVVIEA
jgi:peptidoglycan/xylan/chitin deacetylase (PgdA/CDA1 family)